MKISPGYGTVEDGKDHLYGEVSQLREFNLVTEQAREDVSLGNTKKAVAAALVPNHERVFGQTSKNAMGRHSDRAFAEAKGELKD
jgi:hypothetical protein